MDAFSSLVVKNCHLERFWIFNYGSVFYTLPIESMYEKCMLLLKFSVQLKHNFRQKQIWFLEWHPNLFSISCNDSQFLTKYKNCVSVGRCIFPKNVSEKMYKGLSCINW